MSPTQLRTIVALAVAAHGIGHVMFLIPSLGIASWGQSERSPLLSGLLGKTGGRVVGSILWLAVTAAFIAAGVGLFTQLLWWRPLAIGAAVASLLAVLLYLSGRPTMPVVNATAFDLALLAALVVYRWPPVTLIGA